MGIGGVLIMEVDQGTPPGPARFASPPWRELFKHVCAEADRLGLKVNMNNDAGWCGSGGTWITPELAMQKVTWTETAVEGPRHFQGRLPQPRTEAGYYRDIAVLAFPTPPGNAHVPGFNVKSVAGSTANSLVQPAAWPTVSPEQTISRRSADLSGDPLAERRPNHLGRAARQVDDPATGSYADRRGRTLLPRSTPAAWSATSSVGRRPRRISRG